MKKLRLLFVLLTPVLLNLSARAQPGPPGPKFDGSMAKLFADIPGFSASVEVHATTPRGEMTMPGKMEFSEGKTRFEMDISEAKGANLPPQAAAQMKQMGMGRMNNISRPDKKMTYLIYPDMKAYVEMAMPEKGSSAAEFKSEVTKIGAETIDGHDCVKNKVVVTGPDGETHESTVWNATDMKKFPLKVEMSLKNGGETTMLFKNVKLEKPDSSEFGVPSDYTKYSDMQSMMMSRISHAAQP